MGEKSFDDEIVTLKSKIMDLVYGNGEDEDFDAIAEINTTINAITVKYYKLEIERNRYLNTANALRQTLNEAGID